SVGAGQEHAFADGASPARRYQHRPQSLAPASGKNFPAAKKIKAAYLISSHLLKKRKSSRHGAALPFNSNLNNHIPDLASTLLGLAVVFIGDDGVCVRAIVFESVDFGVGIFAGAECNVVGRI